MCVLQRKRQINGYFGFEILSLASLLLYKARAWRGWRMKGMDGLVGWGVVLYCSKSTTIGATHKSKCAAMYNVYKERMARIRRGKKTIM